MKDRNDFSSMEIESASSSEEGNDSDAVAFVVMLAKDVVDVRSLDIPVKIEEEKERMVLEKLEHLPENKMKSLNRSIIESSVADCSLNNLRQSDVPVKHSFELTENRPIAHLVRRLPPPHNEVIRTDLVKMLQSRIMTPSVSGWSFQVVIASKKDGTSIFFVYYRSLNSLMNPDK